MHACMRPCIHVMHVRHVIPGLSGQTIRGGGGVGGGEERGKGAEKGVDGTKKIRREKGNEEGK